MMLMQRVGIVFAVFFVAVRVVDGSSWKFGQHTHNKWLGLLLKNSNQVPNPCVLLTSYWSICSGKYVPSSISVGEWKIYYDLKTKYKMGSVHAVQVKTISQAIVKTELNYILDFRIALVRSSSAFRLGARVEISQILVVRNWPFDFKVGGSIFMGYRVNKKDLSSVYTYRTLISAHVCYTRLSEYTLACLYHSDRLAMCDGVDAQGGKVTPETIVLLQKAFLGFFIESFDNRGWTCEGDHNYFGYGVSFPAVSPLALWIATSICKEGVILMPMNFPVGLFNISLGQNRYRRNCATTGHPISLFAFMTVIVFLSYFF